MNTPGTDTTTTLSSDRDLADAIATMNDHVASVLREGGQNTLFRTSSESQLFDRFIDALPEDQRPIHMCRCCQRFLENYGSLAAIDEYGSLHPLLPELAPSNMYAEAFALLREKVRRSAIIGAHVSPDETWGTPRNYGKKVGHDWYHFYLRVPGVLQHRDRMKTPSQRAAAIGEEAKMLHSTVAEYDAQLCAHARELLVTGKLYRAEKCVEIAKWLCDLHERLAATKNTRARDAIVWRAAAAAPPGFCHVRSGMLGTLLDDLKAGTGFEKVKRAFDKKMAPNVYMRPTAPLTDGNIEAAEAIIAKLGLAPALRRRFATLADVADALWWPPTPAESEHAPSSARVFDSLRGQVRAQTKKVDIGGGPTRMTWRKFAETVLPSAEAIEFMTLRHGNYCALTTAADPEAPPILQWDRLERRNPVAMYLYIEGSTPQRWGLAVGVWTRVTAITSDPAHWFGNAQSNIAPGIYFLLEGAREQMPPGLALFPDVLRSELHEVRATIAAYSKAHQLEGVEQASACGYVLRDDRLAISLRVTARGFLSAYTIDRID